MPQKLLGRLVQIVTLMIVGALITGYTVVVVQKKAEQRAELRHRCKENREALDRCTRAVTENPAGVDAATLIKSTTDCERFWEPQIAATCKE